MYKLIENLTDNQIEDLLALKIININNNQMKNILDSEILFKDINTLCIQKDLDGMFWIKGYNGKVDNLE